MDEGVDPSLHCSLIAANVGLGKRGAQVRLHLRVLVAESDRADAAPGGGYQHASQRRLGNRKVDARALSAFTIRRGRHAQAFAAALVHSAGRTVSGVVDRLGHRRALAQAILQTAGSAGFGVLVWTQPESGLELTLQ